MHTVQLDAQKLKSVVDEHTHAVIDLLQKFRIPVRIVGGAVRDMLLNRTPRDIDLVADADPSTLIYIFDTHGIDVDYGGIVHGTVKAVFGSGSNQQKVDVSSLGWRIRAGAQGVESAGTHSWAKDSALRDLTINSMSMSMDGTVYDYCGGIEDLKNQTVRMGPDSQHSFVHDPNGIMRYFRAVSMFEHPRIIKSDLQWLKKNVHLLQMAADDKKAQMNWISILRGTNRDSAIRLMCSLGVHKYLDFVTCGSTQNENQPAD